jgi:hypothetical protein
MDIFRLSVVGSNSLVVPANAGTHNRRRQLLKKSTARSLKLKSRGVMVWTAPYGISCARMRLLQISDKGAVREPDYPHWNGYV